MNILLTNDDGIRALGIRTMAEALTQAGHTVHVVAPMRQQSGVSQCLTIFDPLRTKEYRDGAYHGTGVYGTPADCVKLALGSLLSERPDLLISGMNLGANVGPDLLYSGTVAAAIEGSQDGIPSLALSYNDHDACDVKAQADHATRLIDRIPWAKLPKKRVLNVNYPHCAMEDVKGVRVCPQSLVNWQNLYQKNTDPRGLPYFWLLGNLDEASIAEDSDIALLRQNYITISPLRFEFTDSESIPFLRDALS
ncbi:MAG: 5'/3'-nucleotidase SurE [Desulfovibrionaceae bacterium]|nr:5'/3'-nucleotidase SurE [Desulfovibrionaceae bacterium]